jgi:hypothetical protein
MNDSATNGPELTAARSIMFSKLRAQFIVTHCHHWHSATDGGEEKFYAPMPHRFPAFNIWNKGVRDIYIRNQIIH